MSEKYHHLPIFGIGPVYVLTCFVLVIFGLVYADSGLLSSGNFPLFKTPMLLIGLALIVEGIILWVTAVLGQKVGKQIKKGKLVTGGAYALVRNPIYTAFSLVFTGVLVIANNLYLLILPVVFWLYLTALLKNTEERWLREKFGREYLDYCQRVNRVIPWFPKT